MKNDDFSASLSLLGNPSMSMSQKIPNNLKMAIDPIEQTLASLEQSIIGGPAAVGAASCLPPNILNHLNLPIPMPFDNNRNDSNKQDIEMVDNHQFFMPNLNNNSDNNQRSSLSNNQSRPVPLLTTSHGHNTNNSYNQMELNGPNLLESFHHHHQQQQLHHHTNNDNSNLITTSGLNSIFDSNMTTIAPTMTSSSSSSSSNQTKDVMKNSSMHQGAAVHHHQQHPGKHQSQSMSNMSNIPLATPPVMTSMHSNNSQQQQQSKKDDNNPPPPSSLPPIISSQQQQQQPPPQQQQQQQQLLIKPIETMMPSPQDRHKHSPTADMKSFNFAQSMKHAAEQNLKNASSWSSLATSNSPQNTPISAKSKPSSMDSFQQFKFKAKEKADRLKLLEAQELKRTQKEAAEKKHHMEHQKHKVVAPDLELIRWVFFT